MAAETTTPTCEVTGLPLPILPRELRESEALFMPELVPTNFHHHFHPEESPILKGEAGRTLRHSRVQHIDKKLHTKYHRIFEGPEMSDSPEEVFRTIVMSCAGVIPPKAIDLSKPGYEVVDLTEDEIDVLGSQFSITNEAFVRRPIRSKKLVKDAGRYFAKYALDRDIFNLTPEKIDEFLDKRTLPQRRLELGNQVIKIAIEDSVGEFAGQHENYKEMGLVEKRKRHVSLGGVVIKYFNKQHFSNYHVDLLQRLYPGYVA